MIVIVGCGISGLNIGLELIKKYKDVVIYDKSNYVGGRIYTMKHSINKQNIIYECGAARFNKNHKLLIKLIKKYKLNNKIIKIPSGWDTITTNNLTSNVFDNVDLLLSDLVTKSNKISKKSLQSQTLYELTKSLYDQSTATFLRQNYPYYSEINVMNSYDAIRTINNDLDNNHEFYVLDGGLSQLVEKMRKDFIKKGGKIILDTQLIDVDVKNKEFNCIFNNNNKLNVKCTDLILACDGYNLKKMKFLNKFNFTNLIDSVSCQPFLRTYAIYKDCWFKDLPKIVTNEYIKYIIPIDYNSGLIMISYTDGMYAKYWKKIIDMPNGKQLQKNELMKQLKLLFPDKKISHPSKLYNHYWTQGGCYFHKNVNSDYIIKKMIKPTKHNLYICGDSYSSRQAWIEGALETSTKLKSLF